MNQNQSINNLPNIDLKAWSKRLRYIVVGIVALIIVFSMFFTIKTEEVGVILRLGQYDRVANPGLNFKLPLLETVYRVPTERQLKQEFGFRTLRPGVQTVYDTRSYERESLMLTGDLNLGNVEWVVQYRIVEPYNFLFKIRNPEQTLRDISESAMRQVVGDRTVDELLTIGRNDIETQVVQLIQNLCREYETGIKVEQVVLQDINPPDPVKPSFNGVNEAQQQRETLINKARAEYNKVIPRARGQAEAAIQKAEGYELNRVNRAKGEAARFNALLQEYIKAPQVTKKRMYLEVMEEILPKMQQKIIVDKDGSNVLPLLQLGEGVLKNEPKN